MVFTIEELKALVAQQSKRNEEAERRHEEAGRRHELYMKRHEDFMKRSPYLRRAYGAPTSQPAVVSETQVADTMPSSSSSEEPDDTDRLSRSESAFQVSIMVDGVETGATTSARIGLATSFYRGSEDVGFCRIKSIGGEADPGSSQGFTTQ